MIQPIINISSTNIINKQKNKIIYTKPTIPNYKNTNFKQLLKSLSPYIKIKNNINTTLLNKLKLHQYQTKQIFYITLNTNIKNTYKNNQNHINNNKLHKTNKIKYLLYHPTKNTTFKQHTTTNTLKKHIINKKFTKNTHIPILFKTTKKNNNITKQILNK